MRLRLGAAGAGKLCAGAASQTSAAGPSTSPLDGPHRCPTATHNSSQYFGLAVTRR